MKAYYSPRAEKKKKRGKKKLFLLSDEANSLLSTCADGNPRIRTPSNPANVIIALA